MAQLVTRLDEALLAEIDEMVAQGIASSRSEFVRIALTQVLDEHRRRRVGEQIVAAYTLHPQDEDDLLGLEAAARALINEEPW
jgi:metal-responsive CopG/Arc/MetJ family transcriptional regulator